MATTLTVLHPKGGVGRSTTVYMLGAELALRGHRVALIDATLAETYLGAQLCRAQGGQIPQGGE